MNKVVIIQARMGSTRLRGKVLNKIEGIPMLLHIVNRVSLSTVIDSVVVATTRNTLDDSIVEFCVQNDIAVYRGSEENVLERYYQSAKAVKADIIIRLTADNPLIDGNILDEAINLFLEEHVDYMKYKEGLPIGMACEIFTFEALKKAYRESTDKECLEHVTPYMYRNMNKFNVQIVKSEEDYSYLRWTVDTEEDFMLIQSIYKEFSGKEYFSYKDILNAYIAHPEWQTINNKVNQNVVSYSGG